MDFSRMFKAFCSFRGNKAGSSFFNVPNEAIFQNFSSELSRFSLLKVIRFEFTPVFFEPFLHIKAHPSGDKIAVG